jgi:hypothetical protein
VLFCHQATNEIYVDKDAAFSLLLGYLGCLENTAKSEEDGTQ